MNIGRWCLIAFAVLIVSYCLGQQVSKPLELSEVGSPLQMSPLAWPYYGFRVWSNGYLVAYGLDGTFHINANKPAAVLYDEQGGIVKQAMVSFPDAARVGVDDAAVGKSGQFVVSGGITSSGGVLANYIAKIGTDGKPSKVIRTTPFLPVYICVADDDTVWAYGEDRDAMGKTIPSTLLLRQYSFDKGQLRTLLSGSDLGSDWIWVRGHRPGDVDFRCTSQKIILFSRVVNKLVEVDTSSGALRIFAITPLPSPDKIRITGFAVTESGDIFASFHERRGALPAESGIFKLTLDSSGVGSWTAVPNSVGHYLKGGAVEHLLGTDGTNLIYTSDTNGTTHWAQYH